jgi:hypothetical protein
MRLTNSAVLKIMNVLFWIAFIGLCIKTGALLTSFYVSLFFPSAVGELYLNLNLNDLHAFNEFYYILIVSAYIIVSGLKTFVAYLVVKFFMKFDLSKPFGKDLTLIFLQISYVSLGTGVIAIVAEAFCDSFRNEYKVQLDWSGNEILLFAGVIYIIALVFKRGTELQAENDLTV